MKISPIILALRDRCPTLERRIGGTADLPTAEEATHLDLPCAFVLAPTETAEEVASPNTYRQNVNVSFDVVIYVTAEADERGLDAYDAAEDLKREIILAIAGYEPEDCNDWVTFDRAEVAALNNAYLAYRLTFNCSYMIFDEASQHGEELAALPLFKRMHTDYVVSEESVDRTPLASTDITLEEE